MHQPDLVIILLLQITITALVASETDPALVPRGAGPVRAGAVVEWSAIPSRRPPSLDVNDNPFLVITDPAGEQVMVRAFSYQSCQHEATGAITVTGTTELRLRHRFPTAGRYHLVLAAAGTDEILVASDIDVEAGDDPPGPARICPTNPLLLAHADGTPFIPIGVNLCWASGKDPLSEHRRMLDAFAAQGGNHIRLWTSSWFGQIEGDGPGEYRLDHAWLIDQVLAHAQAQGVQVTLVLDNFHDIVLGKSCPYGTTLKERLGRLFATPLNDDYARRLRYVAARYGAHDNLLAWELCNELDLTGITREQALAWLTATGGYLHDVDPYLHLRTVSLSNQDWATVAACAEVDLTQIHHYVPYLPDANQDDQDGYAPLLRHQLWAMRVGKPFCFAEIGHQGSNEDNPGNQADATGLLLRQQAWGALLVGAYGTGMNWWWDIYLDRQGLWPVFAPIAKTVARIDWTDVGLRPYRPDARAELRLIGWQSPDQVLLRAVPWADTWYSQAIEGRVPGTEEFAERLVLITGLRPGRLYDLVGIDAATGKDVRSLSRSSDTQGRLVFQLNQTHPDEIILLRIQTR